MYTEPGVVCGTGKGMSGGHVVAVQPSPACLSTVRGMFVVCVISSIAVSFQSPAANTPTHT